MSKEYKKMDKENLEGYLLFKHRGTKLEIKKGKGSKYSRTKEKERTKKELK